MNAEEAAIWETIDPERLPRHVAVIMDGNGRWAKKRFRPRILGHREGVKAVDRVVTMATEINIPALTLYSFSSENWKRPPAEVEALMGILREFLQKELKRMKENNIRFNTIGRIADLPEAARRIIEDAKEQTAANDGTVLSLALSYGSRNEILDAVRALAGKARDGEIKPEAIAAADFEDNLYTRGLPEVDLLIRTSGELRISNFLLWQMAYAELYFTELLWPDFNGAEFLRAIKDYQGRERRFGLAGDQLTEQAGDR